MKYEGRDIDHIVYAVKDLKAAVEELENQLGVRPSIGGRHLNKGTKNALLNLGNSCYLEILAVDEENKNIEAPRWMGVDLIEKSCTTRWALKSNRLIEDQKVLQSYDLELREIFQGERQTNGGEILKWKMLLPKAKPKVELAPFMVDWSESSVHPCDNLPDQCVLEKIEFTSKMINPKLEKCFIDLFEVSSIQQNKIDSISVTIKGPKGIFKL